MNICLANDSFPPVIDGVANTVVNYATVIQKKYGNVVVATPKYPKVKDDYPFDVVRYPSVNTNKIFGYRAGYPFSPSAMNKIKKHDISLIHTHCPVVSTLLSREVRELTKAPIVFTYHTKFDIDIKKAIKAKYIQDTAGCGCNLAKVMRHELKKRNIENLKVVYSTETPINSIEEENGRHIPASISTCPTAAGILLASFVINDILEK